MIECQKAAWPEYLDAGMYDARLYELQLAAFPEGQLLAELDGKVVGYATSLIVQLDGLPHTYTYNELTGSGTFSTHVPGGDTLYGADIAVHPDVRGRGIAGRLYAARKKLLKRHNLRRMVAYGRLSKYAEHAGQLTAAEYVEQVVRGERQDPALSAHLRAGYQVKGVRLHLMRDDPSLNYATLLEFENPEFDPHRRRIAAAPLARPAQRARVCAAQYLMRPIGSWKEFEKSVQFFVEAATTYHTHVLVLPELFTAVLFSTMKAEITALEAMVKLASMHGRYVSLMKKLATEHQIHIVAGSHPVRRDGSLYNVAHLFTPGGGVHTQDKLHITPHERQTWGIRPGQRLRVFELPFARVAILVCYDIEFPELARLAALAGAEVLLVPFSTDEQMAYQRVRYCAQARAIENGVYVVIAGNAGNLPSRHYMLNYARSAIFTPSDFGFPSSAVSGEAEANVETIVVGDLDFGALAQARDDGTVRPLHDRRPDLYDLQSRVAVEVVRGD